MSLPRQVLAVDVGGSHIKILASGEREARRVESCIDMDAAAMVGAVRDLAVGWRYDVISIGIPAPVVHGRVLAEPHNLGIGWVGFDFGHAFELPVRVVNDAAMQALGSYQGGRMLFLGLGTGLGSALVVDGIVEPMELGHLPYRKGRTYEDYVGERGLKRLGKKRWRRKVREFVMHLGAALEAEYVVLGGGNAKRLKELPPGARIGDNSKAFIGGFRLWQQEQAPAAGGEEL